MSLPEFFLNAQRPEIAEALKALDEFFTSFTGVEHYFQCGRSMEEGRTIHYKSSEKSLFAIFIQREKPYFRAAVKDPKRILTNDRMMEENKIHFQNTGYRSFEFGHDQQDIEFAKKEIQKIIDFHM
jgi:hypothetical protein